MALINDRDLRQATEERVVTIREVNLVTSTLTGEDMFGQRLQASLNLSGQIIAIPSVGEKWTFARQGNLWYPSKNQQETISDLVPGDKKLNASGVLYLNGTNGVVINGYDWNSTLDAINTDIQIALTSAIIKAPELSARNVIQPTIGTAKALTLKGHAAQSVPLLEVTDSADASLASITHDGKLVFGDTNLYRASADNLKTDDSLQITGTLYGAWTGSGWGITVNSAGAVNITGSNPAIYLGANVNLYTPSADVLKTDDAFQAASYAVGTTPLAALHLSNGTTGSGAVVLANAPTLTGVPIAPTAAALTNTTQIATTAYVISNAGTATPTTDSSTAAVGSANRYAREDHRHALTGQLDAFNSFSGVGMIARTGLNTFAARTITGTSGQITVTNGDGTAGAPNISLPATITQATTFSSTLTAGATGKTAITISDNGSQSSGITIGGDTNIYRFAANELATDDSFEIRKTGSTDVALSLRVPAESQDRMQIQMDGTIGWGSGSAASDTILSRTAANELSMASGDTFKLSSAGIKFSDNSVMTTANNGPKVVTSLVGQTEYDGAMVWLKTGAGRRMFVFDATLGRWMSDPWIAVAAENYINHNTTVSTVGTQPFPVCFDYNELYSAGAHLQVRVMWMWWNDSNSNGEFDAVLYSGGDAGGSYAIQSYTLISGYTGGPNTGTPIWSQGCDIGDNTWRDIGAACSGYSQVSGYFGLRSNASPSNTITYANNMHLICRLVSD